MKNPIAKLISFIIMRGFAIAVAGWIALLAANFALCEGQASCPVPAAWIVSDSFKFIFNRLIPFKADIWFRLYLSWFVIAIFATVLLLIVHYSDKRTSGADAQPSTPVNVLNYVLIALYAPLWAGLISLATIAFFAERKVFLLILLAFSAAGLAQNTCVKFTNKFLWRTLSAASLTAAVVLLIPRIVSLPFSHIARGDLLYIFCILIFLIIEAGSGAADALRKSRRGGDWLLRQFRTAAVILAAVIITLPQINHPRPPECSDIARPGSGVRIVLGKYRAFTVATSYDSNYLYYGSDYNENIYRVALKENRPPEPLFTGKFGVTRFREDPDSALLYVPVIGLFPNDKLVIVDEKTFEIKNEIPTPPWIGYQVFDMALDKHSQEALLLGRYARVLFYKFGENSFEHFGNASSAFPGPEILGHKIMRIEVNEQKRVAYICPYPALGSPRIIAEMNLDPPVVLRTREFDSHPNVVRVIDGGKRLLVGLDMSTNILELDADTLKVIRTYPAGFSVRDIAVDERDGVMAVGNFLTGTVNLVRLSDGKLMKTWRVGRGVRSVHIDSRNQAAYAATLCGAVEMKLP